jgi:CBS domain-containing protein
LDARTVTQEPGPAHAEAAGVREFFRVKRLIPDTQDLATVPAGTLVRDALRLMDRTGFSQVPVTAGTTVIGVFSYRSLARNLSVVRRQDDPLDAVVDDLLEDLAYVRTSDEIGEIVKSLDRDGAVLVGDEEHLIAVATSSDLVIYLWEATRPFVLLQDIELAVRDLVRVACPAVDELADRIAASLPSNTDRPTPRDLNELTLYGLLQLVVSEQNFGQCFRRTFGNNRDLVLTYLDPVREVRNKVFHFRDDVTAEEMDALVIARRWLLRKVQTAASKT